MTKPLNIHIYSVPHNEQRYDTCGDWQKDPEGDFIISVSHLSNRKHMLLIALHELVEAILCEAADITAEEVDAFDLSFAAKPPAEPVLTYGSSLVSPPPNLEPGDDPSAPYHLQHKVATSVEEYLATELEVNWKEYGKAVGQLEWRVAK